MCRAISVRKLGRRSNFVHLNGKGNTFQRHENCVLLSTFFSKRILRSRRRTFSTDFGCIPHERWSSGWTINFGVATAHNGRKAPKLCQVSERTDICDHTVCDVQICHRWKQILLSDSLHHTMCLQEETLPGVCGRILALRSDWLSLIWFAVERRDRKTFLCGWNARSPAAKLLKGTVRRLRAQSILFTHCRKPVSLSRQHLWQTCTSMRMCAESLEKTPSCTLHTKLFVVLFDLRRVLTLVNLRSVDKQSKNTFFWSFLRPAKMFSVSRVVFACWLLLSHSLTLNTFLCKIWGSHRWIHSTNAMSLHLLMSKPAWHTACVLGVLWTHDFGSRESGD